MDTKSQHSFVQFCFLRLVLAEINRARANENLPALETFRKAPSRHYWECPLYYAFKELNPDNVGYSNLKTTFPETRFIILNEDIINPFTYEIVMGNNYDFLLEDPTL